MYIFTLLFSFLSASFYLSLLPFHSFFFPSFLISFSLLIFVCFFDLSDRFGTRGFRKEANNWNGRMMPRIKPCVWICNIVSFFHLDFECNHNLGKKNVSQLTYLTIHSLLFLLSLKWAHFWGYFKHLILQSLCFPIYRRINQKCFTS